MILYDKCREESPDTFYEIVRYYEGMDFLNALRIIIPSSAINYDTLACPHSIFWYLINYFDAMVFGGRLETVVARMALYSEIQKDPYAKVVLKEFSYLLEQENSLQNECIASLETIDLQKVPSDFRSFIRKKIDLWDRWKRLLEKKPVLSSYFYGVDPIQRMPWHCFSYDTPIAPFVEEEGEIPFILLGPNDTIDYTQMLSPYKDRKVIYVCATYAEFMHMLQWETVAEAFASPKAVLYVLEGHPKVQMEQQIVDRSYIGPLQLVVLTSNKVVVEVATLLKSAFEAYSNYEEDSACNVLYAISKNVVFRMMAERYGKSRSFALNIFQIIKDWHDPYKGLPPPNTDVGPPLKDFLQEIYSEAAKERVVRPLTQKKKQIAHVVSQIVDGSHAPTMLLKNILINSSHDKYDISLISTERLCHYPLEYPVPWRDSFSSSQRGAGTIGILKAYGIKVMVNSRFVHYEATARYLASMMNLSEYDVVVFHGPDETNNMIGSLSNAPLRVLFDHGTLPSYPCYDLAILSSEDALRLHHERLGAMGMETCSLMFSLDVRKGWDTRIYTKEELGFPKDSFIMTTISHHLNARLSDEMCYAIAEILQRNPNAYYAPIGPIQEEKFRAFFAEQGVGDRVIFMGNLQNPSQYARSMQLYLNEFPFGSGVAIFDAMAAGCPIVSMYDELGPQQARYGGTYFGIDRVVKNGSKEEYVALACRMIQDRAFYQDASQHALKQYEQRVNEKKYSKDFETIIEKVLYPI